MNLSQAEINDLPKHIPIMVADLQLFKEQLSELSEIGYKVISSNAVPNSSELGDDFFYFALMVKDLSEGNSISNKSNDFHYKILDELNEVKFELQNIVNSIKYLGG